MAEPADIRRLPERRTPLRDPRAQSLAGQVDMLAEGRLTSTELTSAALERIEALQPALRAFRVVHDERALEAAAQADRRLAAGERGALLGVPTAIKDDVDLRGETTPFGCGGRHRPAERDSEVVRRLKEAGAVIVGKTMTPEVGQWHFSESAAFGAARNPWNPEHTPGGSSGGAAAAVAAGMVAAAIGSDGAGSIRIPSAWCGLVGLKPQRGRVSTWPEVDSFHGLACIGPIARTAADAALLLDAISGSHPEDLEQPPEPALPFEALARREPRPLRVAVSFATPFGVAARLDPEIRAATERVAERLAELGHFVDEADPPYGLVGPALVPRAAGGVREWCERLEDREALEPRTRTALRLGSVVGGRAPLRLARRAEAMLRSRIGRIFDSFDVVLTPTTAQPAPRVGALAGRSWWETSSAASAICPYAFAWNVLGWPALSAPAGTTADGLPIGAQLLGRPHDEGTLLGLCGQLERVERWSDRRPQLAA